MSRQVNFILQQGLAAPAPASCSSAYAGLRFQPWFVGLTTLIATAAQVFGQTVASAAIFGVLGAVLWWSAAIPRFNPFDHLYNVLFSARSGFRLQAAPAPRRFAQFLAGALSLVIAALLVLGHAVAAMIVAAVLLAAVAALVFGGFCFGSYVFHVLTGRRAFANCTLPWSPPPA
ncbi:MAG TPA: DUF4395 family protein [Thermoanaerobaculia bacterium]|nr:DUF4395 family protein [Thermoanaerobaculia bacterium]